VCALLAWSALLDDDPAGAGRLLEEFWADNSATTPLERLVNAWVVWAARLEHLVVLPAVSPYDIYASVSALEEFRRMLERRVDSTRLAAKADGSRPMLLVGAVDVRSGEFKAFNSRREAITADMILASAAIPTLFRSVRVQGGTYWDGLFSQNPPVRELVDTRPDELWVIQINPRRWDGEPQTMVEIADRRNELAGNLSLHQELRFIEKVDQLLEDGRLARDGKYKQIVVRRIELIRPSQVPVARHRLQAQPRPRLPPRADRPRRGPCRRVSGRPRLRGRLATPGPRGGAGLLRRRRRAALRLAVPGPGYPAWATADPPVRPPAPDHRPTRRPDPGPGGPRPGHVERAGLPGRPGGACPGPGGGGVRRRPDPSLRLGLLERSRGDAEPY
jgi:predicted acylesterase/phospholipase RssA